MQPVIVTMPEKKLVGKRIKMSFSKNKTPDLWRSFMPGRKEIRNNVGPELYSVEVYGQQFFDKFNPEAEFDKWAAVEVTDFDNVPADMDTLTAPGGLYAIFLYKGPASAAQKMYEYIFRTWLPGSDFLLDNRPHYAIMGDKYKNEDPGSEEELCIPIKPKHNSR
ncbi:MAG: AraC family transcriptional regulator [Dehalococcoidia bacterium]|nr:MAG: AraC family transcriptional regulator [Dehalococcoidia bacterium]